MNLTGLIKSDGFTLTQVTPGEYCGACPWCGGDDRFRVWPDRGKFWCRGCNKSGDGIQYLRDFRGMTYKAACETLGIEAKCTGYAARPHLARPRPDFIPKEMSAPGDLWTAKAAVFLKGAQRSLWTDAGKEALTILHGKGLTDATIKAAGLGYNMTDIYQHRETFGLLPELKPDGTHKRLWLPAGIIIPYFKNSEVIRLRVRRNDGDPRYVLISGSDMRSMAWQSNTNVVVIVESELDGWLLSQEAGDLVTVIALGSAQAKPDTATHAALKEAEIILIALDTDDAGAKASWQFWPNSYGVNVKRWPTIYGKDASEAYQNGLDLRTWIKAGLPQRLAEKKAINGQAEISPFPADWLTRFDEVTLERLAIMTVDGHMSNAEALEAVQ